MKRDKPIRVQYQTLVVIWFALLTSLVIFFGMVWFIKPELLSAAAANAARDGLSNAFFGEMPLVTLAFFGVSIVFLLLSFVLSRQHMRRAVRDQDAGCVQTGLVLGCALSEVPSLLGIILAFAFDHPYFFVWIAMSLIGILFHFPRKGNLDAATYKLN
jgi:hypothetical protein